MTTNLRYIGLGVHKETIMFAVADACRAAADASLGTILSYYSAEFG